MDSRTISRKISHLNLDVFSPIISLLFGLQSFSWIMFVCFFKTWILLSFVYLFKCWPWHPIKSLEFESKLNSHWLIQKQIKTRKLEGKICFEKFKKEKWPNFRFLFSTFKERRFHWPRVCNFHSTISLRHRNSRGWSFWRHGRPHRGQAGEQQTFIPPRIRTLSPQPQSHRGIQKETYFPNTFQFSIPATLCRIFVSLLG